MQENDPQHQPFLIIDDDPQFLAAIGASFRELSGGRWTIRTATNHSQALEHLKAQPMNLVVLDVEMPVMDGVEFLRLLGRTHPGQQVVMLSERMEETARQTCLDLGAILFLAKPSSPEDFHDLFITLDSLATARSASGFRGVMQQVGLDDVLQMECLARKSSILRVTTGKRQGQIYISEGEIIHAQAGQLEGEMALYGLLALKGGEFKLQPFAEPARRTISGQYQFLLMEAARLRDEGELQPGRGVGGLGRPADFGATSFDASAPTEARGTQIEEVLLCSNAREVLYESKCESIESRLELFAKLEQQANQAAKGTPSGRFHRMWMNTGSSRVLVQIQPAFKLLVRSALPPASDAE